MMRYRTLSCIVILAVALLSCGEAEITDPGIWPQFRGPQGNGVSADTGLPTEWGEDSDNLAWKTALPGRGNSSPIVSHGRVFLTAAVNVEEGKDKKVQRMALALDYETGEILWQTEIGMRGRGKNHRLNTSAAPTPVTDGRHIFAYFGDLLVAFDRDGQILWSQVVDDQYAKYSHYGSASSPVLTDNAVIVAHDRETTDKPYAWLAAFDKKTGEHVWKVDFADGCCSYTTPLIRQRGAHQEVIFTQSGAVVSYDALTGEELWSHALQINQPVASPLTDGDLLAVFSGAHHVRFGAVIKLTGEGTDTQTEELWQTNRMIPQTASPVALDGNLYTVVELGHLICYNLQTGKRIWQKRLPAAGGYRSSLVAADNKIYIQANSGLMAVVEAGNKFNLLAANSLGDNGNASPAIVDGNLLIRTQSNLYRFNGEATVPPS